MRQGKTGACRLCAAVLAVLALCAGLLMGCGASKDSGEKVRDLEFTVAGEMETPQQLKDLIAQKQSEPFKLTYTDNQNLYIAVGYGVQPTGGYSIAVNELYLTDNSIVIRTELLGPEKGENPGGGQSLPYIVIKTEYLENPVVFQ